MGGAPQDEGKVREMTEKPEYIGFRTSGSTGSAKVIEKTAASVEADAAMLLKSFPDLFGDRPYVLATIRQEHMFGTLWRKLLPEIAGCEVYDGTIVSAEELTAAAAGRGKTLLVTTPSFLEKAVESEDFRSLGASLAGVVTSGSLLKKDLSRRVRELAGISPTEIFGSTETGSVAWRRQADGEEWTLFGGVSAWREDDGRIAVDSEFSISRPFVMGDSVEFVSPERFLLLGRADRNVKILEKYVSLPRIEAAMERHPFVGKAHAVASDEPVPRIRALVELSAEGRAALKKSTYGALTAALKRETAGIEPFAFPRRIRYLNVLPYNEQGKLVRSEILPILESRYQEPVSENEVSGEDSFSADLVFVSDAVYFDGHFRNFRILPGVVQLDWVCRCIRRRWRKGPFAGEILRLKFQRPVLPGERVRFTLSRLEGERYSFSFKIGESVCTSGIMAWKSE